MNHLPTNSNTPIAESVVNSNAESNLQCIAFLDRTLHLYSGQTPIQTNIHPTLLDDLLTQFESEVVGKLNTLFEACASNINLSEVCAPTNNFRSWIEVSSEDLEVACLKEANRNFHAKPSGIIKPLMHKVTPTLLLPALVVTPPPSTVQASLVASEPSLEVSSAFGAKKTVVTDEFILENFKRLMAVNFELKEQALRCEDI